MSQQIDPLYLWLGIAPDERPVNHYRMLSLALFETDLDVIQNAADLRMDFVREVASGTDSEDGAKILQQLEDAQTVLLDPGEKNSYDTQLRLRYPAEFEAASSGNHQNKDEDQFDGCHQWLGVPPREQPADHYRLLGLPRFESHEAVIQNAVDQRMAHLRKFQTGKRAELTQKLLNQLAAARLTLLSPKKKADYDKQLRNPKPQPPAEPGNTKEPGDSNALKHAEPLQGVDQAGEEEIDLAPLEDDQAIADPGAPVFGESESSFPLAALTALDSLETTDEYAVSGTPAAEPATATAQLSSIQGASLLPVEHRRPLLRNPWVLFGGGAAGLLVILVLAWSGVSAVMRMAQNQRLVQRRADFQAQRERQIEEYRRRRREMENQRYQQGGSSSNSNASTSSAATGSSTQSGDSTSSSSNQSSYTEDDDFEGAVITESVVLEGISGSTTGGVTALAVSADGSRLAVSAPQEVVVFDTLRWKPIARLRGVDDSPEDAAFHPGGRIVAAVCRVTTGISRYTLRVWDVTTGQLLRARDLNHRGKAVCFSPDGRYLGVAHDSQVSIWDAESLLLVREQPTDDETRIAFSGDSQELVIVDESQISRIPLDKPSLDVVAQLRKSDASSAYSRRPLDVICKGNLVAAPYYISRRGIEHQVAVYDANQGEQLFTVEQAAMQVAAFSPNEQALATADRPEIIRLWSIQRSASTTATEVARLIGTENNIRALEISPDHRHVVSIDSEDSVRVWDVSDVGMPEGMQPAEVSAPQLQEEAVTRFDSQVIRNGSLLADSTTLPSSLASGFGRNLALSPDGKLLACSVGGDVSLLDVEQRQVKDTLDTRSSVYALAYSPDSRYLAVLGWTLQVWNLRSEKLRFETGRFSRSPSGVAFSPDGKYVAVSSDQGVMILDARKGTVERAIQVDAQHDASFAFSADSLSIRIQSRQIADYNIQTGESTIVVRELRDWFNSQMSLDGKLIARQKEILSADDGKLWFEFRTGPDSIALAPDSSFVVTGWPDGRLDIHSTATGLELATLQGHLDDVHGLVLSADGRTLISSSEDRSIRMWDLTSLLGPPAPVDVEEETTDSSADN